MIDYLGFRHKDLEFIGKFLHFGAISPAPLYIHTERSQGPQHHCSLATSRSGSVGDTRIEGTRGALPRAVHQITPLLGGTQGSIRVCKEMETPSLSRSRKINHQGLFLQNQLLLTGTALLRIMNDKYFANFKGLCKCKPSLYHHRHYDSKEITSHLSLERPRVRDSSHSNNSKYPPLCCTVYTQNLFLFHFSYF